MDRSRTGFAGLRLAAFVLVVFSVLPWARAVQATTIDIMLVYDNTATSWVASNGGMAAFSQDVVNRMNQAMQNSGISITFRLVHSMSVAYTTQSSTTTPMTADLKALQAGTGAFAPVAAARNTYGADLVAMLVDHGSAYGYVGQGYLLTNPSGNADYAHTVNAIRSVAIGHTLTHEVGHNLGAHHSKYQAPILDPGPNRYLDNQYSAGWYFTGTNGVNYHTIMAYNSDGYGGRYTEAPLFSTPLKTYQGVAAGHASHGDNARLLGQTKDVIAAYRAAAVVDPTDPTDPVDPTIPLPDPSDFITQQYFDFLSRQPDPAGLDYWVQRLKSGQITRAQVVESFFNSHEFQTKIAPIARLHFAYFDRIPEYESLMYYIERQQTGLGLAAMSQAFAGSPEFIATYGGLDDEEFVELVYNNVLRRKSDAAGRAYWLDKLAAGMTYGEMMICFSESQEYQRLSFNVVQVTMLYVGMLRRAPERAEFDYWVAQISSGRSVLDLIGGFLTSDEYAGRF